MDEQDFLRIEMFNGLSLNYLEALDPLLRGPALMREVLDLVVTALALPVPSYTRFMKELRGEAGRIVLGYSDMARVRQLDEMLGPFNARRRALLNHLLAAMNRDNHDREEAITAALHKIGVAARPIEKFITE